MEDPDHHHQQPKPTSNSELEITHKLKFKLKIPNQEDQEDHHGFREQEQEQESAESNYNRNNNQVDKEQEDEGEEEEDIKGSSSSSAAASDKDNQGIQGLNSIRAASSVTTARVCCPVCEKGFTTGKALGGHMRVHSDPTKPVLNRYPSTNGFRCSLCGKEFRSQKSLFGHMRSHPDRLWRGMQPPSEQDSDPDNESGWVVELPRWGEKGRRGQNNHRVEVAAGDLVMLQEVAESDSGKGGEERMSSSEKFGDVKKRVCNFDPDELYFLQNLGFFLGKNDVVNDEEGAHDQASPKKEGEIVDPTRIHQTRNPGLKETKINGNGKRVRDFGEKLEDGRRWRCSTCNKTFPTHQALGGHMSGHNKEKSHKFSHNSDNIPTKTNHIHIHTYAHVGSNMAALGDHVSGGGDVENEATVNKRKGKKYNKSFPSNNKCRFSSSSGQSCDQTGQKANILELDLNIVPPTAEEDGVVDSSAPSLN